MKKIKKINVLDGSFLLNEYDIVILEKLIEIRDCNITLQIHFSNLRNRLGKKFLSICENYKDKIFLEFGLQTIHVTPNTHFHRQCVHAFTYIMQYNCHCVFTFSFVRNVNLSIPLQWVMFVNTGSIMLSSI